MTCIVRDCHCFVDSCNFTNKANLHTPKSGNTYKTKIMAFCRLCCESEAILFEKFRLGHRPVTGWSVHRENSLPVYRDLGRKNRDLGNRASPASHMNTSIFLQRKEWRGEISETEPARLTGLV